MKAVHQINGLCDMLLTIDMLEDDRHLLRIAENAQHLDQTRILYAPSYSLCHGASHGGERERKWCDKTLEEKCHDRFYREWR